MSMSEDEIRVFDIKGIDQEVILILELFDMIAGVVSLFFPFFFKIANIEMIPMTQRSQRLHTL